MNKKEGWFDAVCLVSSLFAQLPKSGGTKFDLNLEFCSFFDGGKKFFVKIMRRETNLENSNGMWALYFSHAIFLCGIRGIWKMN